MPKLYQCPKYDVRVKNLGLATGVLTHNQPDFHRACLDLCVDFRATVHTVLKDLPEEVSSQIVDRALSTAEWCPSKAECRVR